MENAQLINLSRQVALRRQLDVTANNLANMTTSGYKAKHMKFEEYLMPVAQATAFNRGDRTLSYVQDARTFTDFQAGGIIMTGNPLDLAVDGDGWFAVQMEDGSEAYTRNGSFHLDSTGQLVTPDGRPVLTEGGPITFTTQDGQIDIAADGTISSELGVRGRIRLVAFQEPRDAVSIGNNLMTYTNPQPVARTRVIQGAVEQSNVHGITAVTELIEITRKYESVTKLMKDTYDLSRSAVERLGKSQA
ncbi:flagellar basal-body rod protein FlgF [Pannonibacter indicus]|uniref:Flagellar basal-body rod protein FlgF n=1 Tax=Pannonibacter indicus TaxID=466044 RepID=A0A0K6HLR2_9HYPH|nr:flagellar basal-body rod protein FlgF [Pannonibacter indicus]CUA91756.1 flagellar basal-body rod protein FlgF [Pannonibacter indicus]